MRTWIEACALDDFGHGLFPLDGHDVHSGHPRNLSDLLNHFHADVNPGLLPSGPSRRFFLFGNAFHCVGHALDEFVWDVHAGNLRS